MSENASENNLSKEELDASMSENGDSTTERQNNTPNICASEDSASTPPQDCTPNPTLSSAVSASDQIETNEVEANVKEFDDTDNIYFEKLVDEYHCHFLLNQERLYQAANRQWRFDRSRSDATHNSPSSNEGTDPLDVAAVDDATVSRVVNILNDMYTSEAARIVRERDAENKMRYQQVLFEYQYTFLSNQQRLNGAAKRKCPIDKKIIDAKRKAPYFDEGANPLDVALVDNLSNDTLKLDKMWVHIESRLSNMIFAYVENYVDGPIPRYDSSAVVRGHHVIKCHDRFSKDFLEGCIEKLSTVWSGLQLGLILAETIPYTPVAYMVLPKLRKDCDTILRYLQVQNPKIPMDKWSLIKLEKSIRPGSSSYVVLLSENSLEALAEVHNKLYFCLRYITLRIFRPKYGDGATTAASAVERLLSDVARSEEAGGDAERNDNPSQTN